MYFSQSILVVGLVGDEKILRQPTRTRFTLPTLALMARGESVTIVPKTCPKPKILKPQPQNPQPPRGWCSICSVFRPTDCSSCGLYEYMYVDMNYKIVMEIKRAIVESFVLFVWWWYMLFIVVEIHYIHWHGLALWNIKKLKTVPPR